MATAERYFFRSAERSCCRLSSYLASLTFALAVLSVSSFSATPAPAPESKPPLLPSWRAWYVLVLGALVVEIGLFVYLTRLFA